MEPETIRDVLLLPGETEARHDVLMASGTGRSSGIHRSPGRESGLKRAQLLMEIDVDALKAALDRCQASLDMAQHVGERRQNLHKTGHDLARSSGHGTSPSLNSATLQSSGSQRASMNKDSSDHP